MSSSRGTAGDSDSDYVPAQDGSSGDEDDEAPEFTRLIMQQLMALYRRGGRALGGDDDDDDDDDDDGDDGAGHGNHRSGRQSARVTDPTPEGTKHAFELEQASQLESTPFGQTLRDASCPPPASLLFAVDPASTLVQVGIRDSAQAGDGTGEGAGAGAGAGEEAAVAGTTSSVAMAVSFPPQSAMLTRTCGGLHTLQPSAACGPDPAMGVDSDAAAAASPASSKQPAPAAAALPAAPAPTPANAPSLPKPDAAASAADTTRTPAARGPGGRPVASTVRLLQARALGAVARLGPRRFVSSASSGNGAGGFGRVERAGLGCHFVPNQPENGPGQQVFADVGNGSRVYSGQFSASGDVFIAAWQNNQVMLLNTPSSAQGRWSLLKTVDCEDIRWTVTSTDVSPDEQFMIYSSITEVVHLCNIKGACSVC